jgi:hypothetical protein
MIDFCVCIGTSNECVHLSFIANTSMVEIVAISGDIFWTESFVLKDKPIEQGPCAHCHDDKEVAITNGGKRLSDAKTR